MTARRSAMTLAAALLCAAGHSLSAQQPTIRLSTPRDGSTAEPVTPVLSWTEDQSPPPQAVIDSFRVEIAGEPDFEPVVHAAVVMPRRAGLPTLYPVPEDLLSAGATYHWRVTTWYRPTAGAAPDSVRTQPSRFITERSLFGALAARGFRLQRTVEGPDAGKGANFSFLRTIGEGSVYTAGFALLHGVSFPPGGRTAFGIQGSVEGKLTSDESKSEDAWRGRVGLTVDRSLNPRRLETLYLSLGGKFESDQGFDIKKLSAEAVLTPTLPSLAIGVSSSLGTGDAIRFRWRPFLGAELGRTLGTGDTEVQVEEDEIVRVSLRTTARLSFRFLSRALQVSDVYLWLDDTPYFLPREETRARNFLASGLEFELANGLGIGATYKNGEAPPEWDRVETLGVNLSVRFGS